MEYATLIFALPVTVIAYLVMASFSKAMRIKQAVREESMTLAATSAVAPAAEVAEPLD